MKHRRRLRAARSRKYSPNPGRRNATVNRAAANLVEGQVDRAVRPQVSRVQKELQDQTKQARDRVQQFV